ncbi:DUF4386 family protein [Paractinoplanes durhamensis]|uniref:DUF4386 domain-containing protein n=1 Tax=Paractinoplanes durhamensis TaxID=113563 RepID=A0ABQ3YS58_9ACTN|nr:DUF4386 family protein [Actinoplanes durhamensis]GIE00367.1 hypothetical protein Adu01nite_17170 [Actinoplanes durhamensis]
MNRKLTAALLITAAVLTNVAFTALGSVFHYPDILKEPTDTILTSFIANESAVVTWFIVLAASAALFAPIALGVGRLSANRPMRIAVPVGIAAAVVQVVGLSRWAILVPGYADRGDRDAFETAHHVLGTLIGETFGYALTAAWTLLVLAALGRAFTGWWFPALGGVSAILIATGVASPLGVPGVDFLNFIGYVLFSVWLLAFAALLLFRRTPATSTPAVRAGAAA